MSIDIDDNSVLNRSNYTCIGPDVSEIYIDLKVTEREVFHNLFSSTSLT